ncbi:hypothetical protein ACFXKD_27670 [Nocardiopsis aegyptia]|uniref:hypothetical protein n=1 Tax=Nocardiopsis aegyptia TaxID=220378 RepID=UPI003671B190
MTAKTTVTLTVGRRYAITYTTGKRTVGKVFEGHDVAGLTRYKIARPTGGWVTACAGDIAEAIDLDGPTPQVGDRVTTPHGPGTVTQAPSQMASGWTVRVDLDDKTVTASGHARVRLDDLTAA